MATPVDAGDAVVGGEPLVEHREVGGDEVLRRQVALSSSAKKSWVSSSADSTSRSSR